MDNTACYGGAVNVAILERSSIGALLQMSSSGLNYLWGASSSAPQLLTRVQVLNPNANSATFRLAMLTTPSGSPDAGNAFLAWDTPIAANGVFTWTGNVPLIDRYIYGQGSISGLIFYFDVAYLDPK